MALLKDQILDKNDQIKLKTVRLMLVHFKRNKDIAIKEAFGKLKNLADIANKKPKMSGSTDMVITTRVVNLTPKITTKATSFATIPAALAA